MTSKMYYWYKSTQTIIEKAKYYGKENILEDKYCVDDFYEREGSYRYGVYSSTIGWIHQPYTRFPPAFQLALMLLGVE